MTGIAGSPSAQSVDHHQCSFRTAAFYSASIAAGGRFSTGGGYEDQAL